MKKSILRIFDKALIVLSIIYPAFMNLFTLYSIFLLIMFVLCLTAGLFLGLSGNCMVALIFGVGARSGIFDKSGTTGKRATQFFTFLFILELGTFLNLTVVSLGSDTYALAYVLIGLGLVILSFIIGWLIEKLINLF